MKAIRKKLIDANRLLDHIEKMYKAGAMQSIDDVRYAIIDAPEEEAISVDWMERTFCAGGVYASETYFRRKEAVKRVIQRWREENGDHRAIE